MAGRIGVLESGQPESAVPGHYVRKAVATCLVKKMLAVWVKGRALIRKLLTNERVYQEIYWSTEGHTDGPLGVGNALPFSPRTDPKKHFHYNLLPTGWRRWGYFRRSRDHKAQIHTRVLKVSARPQSHLYRPFIQRTELDAPARLAESLS